LGRLLTDFARQNDAIGLSPAGGRSRRYRSQAEVSQRIVLAHLGEKTLSVPARQFRQSALDRLDSGQS
jgi:hypothetical protein